MDTEPLSVNNPSKRIITRKTLIERKTFLETIELHKLWLQGDPTGIKLDVQYTYLYGLDLSNLDLRYACFRGSNLSESTFRSSDLRCTNFEGTDVRWTDFKQCRLPWNSNSRISEILWQSAENNDQKALAAFAGRMTSWCWNVWAKYQHPEKEWTLNTLIKWIHPEDTKEDVPNIIWKRPNR